MGERRRERRREEAHLKSLRRGDLVDHVTIDVDEAGAVLLLVDDVILHDLIVHGLTRGDDSSRRGASARHDGGTEAGLGGDRGAARESPHAVDGSAGSDGRGGGHHVSVRFFCLTKRQRIVRWKRMRRVHTLTRSRANHADDIQTEIIDSLLPPPKAKAKAKLSDSSVSEKKKASAASWRKKKRSRERCETYTLKIRWYR